MASGWEREAVLVAASRRGPVTVGMMVDDLRGLGLGPGPGGTAGPVVLVHSSLRSLGWVCGGARAVVLALLEVVGPGGTVVVPAHTGLSDPAGWSRPAVPPEWVEVLRETMPPYDPATTPTRGMGAVAEAVRTWPGAQRSAHPEAPFAAVGAAAEEITAGQPLDSGLGERSPLARLLDLDGRVLLLGVGHGNNTTLHLGEERARWASRHERQAGGPMLVDGRRQWVTWPQLDLDASDFPALGAAFEAAVPDAVRTGPVGHAEARLLAVRPMVDFATSWIEANRR